MPFFSLRGSHFPEQTPISSGFFCLTVVVAFVSRYVLANEEGPVEPVTTPVQNLDKEQGVPVGHIRFARGVSLESWLRMRQCPVRADTHWCKLGSSVFTTQFSKTSVCFCSVAPCA